MKPYHNKDMDFLYRGILSLQTREECYAFFEDVCTIKELEDMSGRLDVARLLVAGRSYQEVSKETGASTATISRVNRCLKYGSDGYITVLERLDRMK